MIWRTLSGVLWMIAFAACATSSPAVPASRFADVDYGMGTERDVVVDGIRLRVHEGGVRGAPTIVLLHCFGLSMKVWRDLLPHLERAYHVIAYDAVGHGKSARGVRALTFPMLAKLGLGLMDALDVERATLIGNSMGGGTALQMALAAPERVTRLVLVDAVGLSDDTWFIPLWSALGPKSLRRAPNWVWGAAYDQAVERRSSLVDEIRADLLATRADRALEQTTTMAMYSVVDTIFHTDLTAALSSVQSPTLVLVGRHDRLVTVDHAQRLAGGIPGAELLIFDDLGHLPEMEDADQVAQAILPFLQK